MFRSILPVVVCAASVASAVGQCDPAQWGAVGGGVMSVSPVNLSFAVATVGTQVEVLATPSNASPSRYASYDTGRPLKMIRSVAGTAWTTDGQSLWCFDRLNAATDPLRLRSTLAIPGGVREFAVYYPYVFAWSGQTLRVISYEDPGAPVITAAVSLPNQAAHAAIANDRLYLTTFDRQIMILNIAAPASPTVVTTVASGATHHITAPMAMTSGSLVRLAMSEGGNAIRVIELSGDALTGASGVVNNIPGGIVQITPSFLLAQQSMQRINWSNPFAPTLTPILVDMTCLFQNAATVNDRALLAGADGGFSTLNLTTLGDRQYYRPSVGGAADLAWNQASGHVYIADRLNGLRAVRLTDSGTQSGRTFTYAGGTSVGIASQVACGDGRVLVSDGFAVRSYATTTPASPTFIGTYSVSGDNMGELAASGVAGLVVRNSHITGGPVLDLVDFTGATPALRDSRPLPNTALNSFRRVRAFGNLAIAVSSREARMYGFSPTTPQSLTTLGTMTIGTELVDVGLSDSTAYLLDNAGWLHVFDVSNPAAPSFVASRAGPRYGQAIAVSGDWLAIVGWQINMFSIHDRHAPAPGGSTALVSLAGTVDVVPGPTGPHFVVPQGSYGVRVFAPPSQWTPVITESTGDTRTCLGGAVSLQVTASAPPSATYQWYRTRDVMTEPIVGATTPTLILSGITGEHANWSYQCEVTSACGVAITEPALLSVCIADANCSGDVSVQDIFTYLVRYFARDPAADVNGVGGVSLQDLFDFLTSYFAGCPVV